MRKADTLRLVEYVNGSKKVKSQCLSASISCRVGSKVSAQAFESRTSESLGKIIKARSEDDARSGDPGAQRAKRPRPHDDGDSAEVRNFRCSRTAEAEKFKCVQESISIVQECVWRQ